MASKRFGLFLRHPLDRRKSSKGLVEVSAVQLVGHGARWLAMCHVPISGRF